MKWLEKMDAVINTLYQYSGHNPTFVLLQKWLYEKHTDNIDKGEIEDILLYLHRKGLIYCEWQGNRDSKYIDNVDAYYLISCEGKLFIEQELGFEKQQANKISHQLAIESRNERTERNEQLLVNWTQNLANRTADLTFWTRLVAIGAIGLVIWETIAYYLEHHIG